MYPVLGEVAAMAPTASASSGAQNARLFIRRGPLSFCGAADLDLNLNFERRERGLVDLLQESATSRGTNLESLNVARVRCADGFALALLAASASRSAHGTGSVQVVATLVFRVVSIVSGAVLVMTRML